MGNHARIVEDGKAAPFFGILFVRAFMLFVQDDQAQVGQRCEECTARPYNYVKLAVTHRAPDIIAFAGTERRMNHRDSARKTSRKTGNSLGCQCNLGHKDNCLAALCQYLFDSSQIDLCLTAACNSMQQKFGRRAVRRSPGVAHSLPDASLL